MYKAEWSLTILLCRSEKYPDPLKDPKKNELPYTPIGSSCSNGILFLGVTFFASGGLGRDLLAMSFLFSWCPLLDTQYMHSPIFLRNTVYS